MRLCVSLILLFAFFWQLTPMAQGGGRYTQIVLPFPNERSFEYYFHRNDNALVLEVQNTTIEELTALDHVDETLIRRVELKEKNANVTQIRLVLRDRNIRATIASFSEPHRIAIDLFDKNFAEERDAKTGFPFTSSKVASPNAATGYEDVPVEYPQAQPSPQKFSMPARSLNNRPPKWQLQTQDSPTSFSSQNHTKRRLLQPSAPDINSPEELVQALKKIPQGMGGAWKQFPPYIYRVQLATFKTGKSYKDFLSQNAHKALSSMEAMADHAGRLFDLGHEGQALVAYQQVIHKAPLLFDKHPMHLWRLAETQLGQGNLTLADGYYQALITKHPDHPLRNFAQMRRLDVRAIRLLNKGQTEGYDVLAGHLDQIKTDNNQELQAQIAIRKVYWTQNRETYDLLIRNPHFIPLLTEGSRYQLESSYNKIDVEWTGFLVATLLLNDYLSPKAPWDQKTADIASHYFKNYRGKNASQYADNLKSKLTGRINNIISDAVDNSDFLGAIKTFESLDPNLRQLPHTPKTSWSLGQAYRLLGQSALALPHYRKAAEKLKSGEARFQSQFWLLMALNDTANEMTTLAEGHSAERQAIVTERSKVDLKLWQNWQDLKGAEQAKMLVALRVPLEMSVRSEAMLSAPARILLQAWDKSLSSKAAQTTSKDDSLRAAYGPSASTVNVLSSLADKFKKIGRPKDWEKSRLLLSKLDPKSFDADADIEKTWATSLVELAEYYRNANQYLDAGKIYTLTGSKSRNWEGRAEALYKGGLLLFRAGRRQDAVDALTRASQDGNNLLYSELAKKRLDQLNRK